MNAQVMKRVRSISLLMLAVVLVALFFHHLDPARATKMFNSYVNLVPFVFLGITLCMHHGRRSVDLWLGYAWLAWFVASRVLLGDLYMARSSFVWFTYECLACLFALSFAWTLQDGQKMTGVKLTAAVMIIVTTALYAVGLYAAWTGDIISIPRIGGQIGVGGDQRLNVLTHPNTTGAVGLIALFLAIWLMVSIRRCWVTVLCCISCVILYVVCALTSSRTSMIQIACFLGMMAALALLRHPPKVLRSKLLRFLCAAAAALLVFVVSFESFSWVVGGMNAAKNAAANSRAMAAEIVEVQPDEAKEAKAEIHVRERPITEGLTTLTGRTQIFSKAFEVLRSNPKMLLAGTTQRYALGVDAITAHNAYLQVLMCQGIPGLLIVVLITLRVLWLCFKVFFLQFDRASVPELIIACMLPAMLLNTITEPILFYDAVPVFNVIFFLLYGYLSEVERRLRKA